MSSLLKILVCNFPPQKEISSFLARNDVTRTIDSRIRNAVAERFNNSSCALRKLEGAVLSVLQPFSEESHWSEPQIQGIKIILITALRTLATPKLS